MNNALLLGFLLVIGDTAADTGQINCTAPTQREDGTALAATELSHFNAYLTNGTPKNYVDTVESETCTFTIPLLPVARDAVVTAVDTDGRESLFSKVVSLPAGKALPNAPSSITITIQYGK